MNHHRVSVIIPTRNRHDKLARTVAALRQQSLPPADYEIIVVDDGSEPAVTIAAELGSPRVEVIRLEGVERSMTRNTGARAANGRLLVFVDDDIEVAPRFLAAHWQAHLAWPGALAVGAIRLVRHADETPFVAFRQRLEANAVPTTRGPTEAPNFCAAANMAIGCERFFQLAGFDPYLSSAEDQDLALRHTASGGQIVYVPEAEALHHDRALDIRNYCRRTEWGAERMLAFCRRYPDWPENVEREKVNGPISWGGEPLGVSLRKLIKWVFSPWPIREVLFLTAAVLERTTQDNRALDRVYRLLLGIHIFRGYQRSRRIYARTKPQRHPSSTPDIRI